MVAARWARSGDLRPAQIVLAAQPGAGAKTRLTEEEEEEEEEAGLRRLINLRVASPAPKPVALGSGYGLNEDNTVKPAVTAHKKTSGSDGNPTFEVNYF